MTEGQVRIVVGEDEALIRLDLVEMLGELGYDVVGQAGDGETVVELAERLRPDVVFLDVKMPRLDGLGAAELIHQGQIAPVIILTAFSQLDLVRRARDAGVMAYLVKPFGRDDLAPAIEVAVSRWAEQQALAAEVTDLQERLVARTLIDRAKALLQSQGMTEAEAFRHLQRQAMDGRSTMADVARQLLATS